MKLTNDKLAGDFIYGDVIDDGYANVVFVPRDFR